MPLPGCNRVHYYPSFLPRPSTTNPQVQLILPPMVAASQRLDRNNGRGADAASVMRLGERVVGRSGLSGCKPGRYVRKTGLLVNRAGPNSTSTRRSDRGWVGREASRYYQPVGLPYACTISSFGERERLPGLMPGFPSGIGAPSFWK